MRFDSHYHNKVGLPFVLSTTPLQAQPELLSTGTARVDLRQRAFHLDDDLQGDQYSIQRLSGRLIASELRKYDE